VREGMKSFSAGQTRQSLRSVVKLDDGGMFGVMPGALGGSETFGAKLVSVFEDPERPGRHRHRGLVVLFNGESGEPLCTLNAEEITLIRTAAASAVATDALALPGARTLGMFGCGAQAWEHLGAICAVRPIEEVIVWGRSPEGARAFAERASVEHGVAVRVARHGSEAAAAQIVCTVTASTEPILQGVWVGPGTHVNVVGSSMVGPAEIDGEMVRKSRFFADSREGVIAQGGEFVRARAAGLIKDNHIVGEIGEVLLGTKAGRTSDTDVTVYKSLGHIVQDLVAARLVLAAG
jgi:ornithine cyclodeaminase/alanine dehydrogenase-like protein (mu-crystallin family)